MERVIQKIGVKIPPQAKAVNVAAYARVSSGKDAMLHSLSAQVSYYSSLIQQQKGWNYCGVYSDEAKTGTKDERSGFQRLLADCRAGKIDLIITKAISRFARNTVTLLEAVRELKALGIDVYFEEQNIHSLSADGELMLTILASYAQEESLSASENQKWRIRKAFEEGRDVCIRSMFGFELQKGKLIPDQGTAAVVREIYSRIIAGESFASIANDLNDRGVKGTLGGKWTPTRICRLVSNEKCMGDSLLQKKFTNNHLEKREMVNHGELPMYYAEETHEGIVDKATYQEAARICKARREKYSHSQPPHYTVFSGLIQCPKCGKSYRRVTSNGSVGWNCATYIRKGKAGCHGKKIPETVLQAITAEALRLDHFEPETVREKIERIIIPQPNHVLFCFKDGSRCEKIWKDRSRSESWTAEMKEQARQKKLKQRGEKTWREQ